MKKTDGKYCNPECIRLNAFDGYSFCNYYELEVVEIPDLDGLQDVDKCPETGKWLRHEFCLSCHDCENEFDFEQLTADKNGLEYCPECWGEISPDGVKFDGYFCEKDCKFFQDTWARCSDPVCVRYDWFFINPDGGEPELLRPDDCIKEFGYESGAKNEL